MHFKTVSSKKTVKSKDSFSRKWSASTTVRAVNLGNVYIIKVKSNIDSSFGITLGNFELMYLKDGKWLQIANGYDIDNDIMSKFKMGTYDSIELAYEQWFNLCIDYVIKIEDGL